MPRRREVPKRIVLPDPKFGSEEVSKFMNVVMSSGKKSVAERIVYGTFEQITSKSGKAAFPADLTHAPLSFFPAATPISIKSVLTAFAASFASFVPTTFATLFIVCNKVPNGPVMIPWT